MAKDKSISPPIPLLMLQLAAWIALFADLILWLAETVGCPAAWILSALFTSGGAAISCG